MSHPIDPMAELGNVTVPCTAPISAQLRAQQLMKLHNCKLELIADDDPEMGEVCVVEILMNGVAFEPCVGQSFHESLAEAEQVLQNVTIVC